MNRLRFWFFFFHIENMESFFNFFYFVSLSSSDFALHCKKWDHDDIYIVESSEGGENVTRYTVLLMTRLNHGIWSVNWIKLKEQFEHSLLTLCFTWSQVVLFFRSKPLNTLFRKIKLSSDSLLYQNTITALRLEKVERTLNVMIAKCYIILLICGNILWHPPPHTHLICNFQKKKKKIL